MIDKSAAQNLTFKARLFGFSWVFLTGISWFVLDKYLNQDWLREFYIFLQAWFASFSPVQLFGQKPSVQIDGQSYKASELAVAMLDRQNVQRMINYFFIFTPIFTLAVTSSIFYFSKRKKEEHQSEPNQLNKWSGK